MRRSMNRLHVVCLSTFKREHVCEARLKERMDIGTLAKLGKKGEVQARVLKMDVAFGGGVFQRRRRRRVRPTSN